MKSCYTPLKMKCKDLKFPSIKILTSGALAHIDTLHVDWHLQAKWQVIFSFQSILFLITFFKSANCSSQPSMVNWLSSPIFPCLSSSSSHLHSTLDHTNHTFSESYWSKDIKTHITKCLMHKNTNTNTQIQFEFNLQISLTCAIFLKR